MSSQPALPLFPEPASPSHEARLLAQLLRSGRVVLLLGEPQADRSGLIRQGLMPLLARRASDHGAPAHSPTAVASTPDRRKEPSDAQERLVVFDRWTTGVGGPLPHLRHSVAAALGVGTAELEAAPARLDEALAAWTQTRPVRLLLLLDCFEDHLLAPHPGPGHAQVTDELVRTLNRPGLPVSVLLSLTEAAAPHLAGMRSLVPGLEDLSLRLKAGAAKAPGREAFMLPFPGAPAINTADLPTPQAAMPERHEARRGPVERPAIRSDDVYALINSTLSRVATGSSANPMLEGRPASSEPDIEAFQAPLPPGGLGSSEPVDTFPVEWKDGPGAKADLPVSPPATTRAGWWRRLLQGLGRKP